MPGCAERFVDVGGVRTRYFDKGRGPVLVLIHGGHFGATTSADAAEDWDLNFDGLAEWARVVAFDKLGQGWTANPAGEDDYTMAAVVRHAAGFLRALGIENAHLVGHSRGGYVACRLTVDHPELVASCAIVNSNSCAPFTGRNEYVFANKPAPALGRESQRWVLERYSFDPAHVTETWLDALVAISERPEYREAVARMTGDGFLWTKFLPGLLADKEEMFRILAARGIQRPVLQVWSRNDETVSHAQAEALYRILAEKERRARWQVFDRAGHFSFREHPKRFNEVVRSFVHAA